MQNMQEIFNRIETTKADQRKIKSVYREALENSKSYQEVVASYKEIKEKKKKIEETIKEDFKTEMTRLNEIKTDLESDKLLMSDLAINEIVKGHLIEIIDKDNNKYEPLFSVRFKKLG